MSDARTALDAYARSTPFDHEAASITREQVSPAAFRALRAVLALHLSDRGAAPDPDGRCFECAETYPCATVRAITSALGDTTP